MDLLSRSDPFISKFCGGNSAVKTSFWVSPLPCGGQGARLLCRGPILQPEQELARLSETLQAVPG